MESITKQAENARKYERILEYGLWCLTGYTNGNSEADTVNGKRGQQSMVPKDGRKYLTERDPSENLVHKW